MGDGSARGAMTGKVSRRRVLSRVALIGGGMVAGAGPVIVAPGDPGSARVRKRRKGAGTPVGVAPARVVPGAVVTAAGSGFRPGSTVEMSWIDGGAESPVLATARADRSGRVRGEFAVPDGAIGTYPVSLRAGSRVVEYPLTVSGPTGSSVAVGLFEQAGGGSAPWSTGALDGLFGDGAANPAIVMWYQAWGASTEGWSFNPVLLDRVSARGAVPMITWEPWDPGRGTNQPEYRLARIASALRDPESAMHRYARSWANGLRDWIEEREGSRRVLLRFAHEMNGDWYPWAVGKNGNEAEDYVDAWRALRTVFDEAGADGVEWVWCPNVEFAGSSSMTPLYPGDDVVDWVALDGYNWGAARGHRWQAFRTVFGDSLAKIQRLQDDGVIASDKPMMIAETGCNPDGGDKAAWIRSALFSEIPLEFPQVRAVVWFNANKEHRWRFDSDAASERAFRAAVRHAYYRGSLLPAGAAGVSGADAPRASGAEAAGDGGKRRRPRRQRSGQGDGRD